MKKQPVRSLTAICLRLGTVLLVLWLVCMACFTYGTAQFIFRELTDQGYELGAYTGRLGLLDAMYDGDDPEYIARKAMPGAVEYGMLDAMACSGVGVSTPAFNGFYPMWEELPSVFRDKVVDIQTAFQFLDRDGNVIHQSSDYLYFSYCDEVIWQDQAEDHKVTGYGWVDLCDETDSRYLILRNTYNGVGRLYDYLALRMTGYFDGSRFEPLAMAICNDRTYREAIVQTEPVSVTVHEDGSEEVSYGEYTISQLDAMGLLEWEVRFDNTAPSDRELMTIYACYPDMYLYDPGKPVRYGSERHENLLALLDTMGYYQDKGSSTFYSGASQHSLWNLIVFSSRAYYDLTDYESSDPWPEADFTLMTAMQASPIKIAMIWLQNVYLVTFALTALLFLLLRRSIKRNLTEPLETLNGGIRDGWIHLPGLWEKRSRWQEPRELEEHYVQTKGTLQSNKNELSRLNTALQYARSAEENRRKMISSITHELKTPLAVIHGYAEGLQAHIAEDKRDRYIDIILSETERMDAMVLEMLDLSRLEAGKVKLAQDNFSLTAMTESVLSRLELAAKAKELTIRFDSSQAHIITADESRISQVVENFLSNALKYTPVGGTIEINIQKDRQEIVFSVENTCNKLSQEALRRVWDTFYRADDARSGGGTGLGLAIAKEIIELHGGRCSAYNTKTGVLFQFTLN